MTQKIVVGPVAHGFRNDIPPFYLDNDSFPTLVNAYQWRARAKRKRGTSPICRLERFFNSAISSYGSTTSITLDGSGNGNLLTGFSLDSGGNIVPGSVQFTDATASVTYTDPTEDGYLTPTGTGGANTINYSTGAIHIPAAAGDTINAVTFVYYPDLPAMDIEELVLTPTQFPQTLVFDTRYSYQIVTAFPYYSYDVSFYKNPPVSASLPSYVPKSTPSPVRWNGQNYQQFWSTNYENALWATNGITQPFATTNIGMQFKLIATIVYASATTITITITEATQTLFIGDFVFINEVLDSTPMTPTYINSVNLQSGYVTAAANAAGTTTITVKLPNATVANDTYSGGIVQYLTSNLAAPTKDCIRWYDGDPTNGSQFSPVLSGTHGWVNFSPPIYSGITQSAVDDVPPSIYYLVGARMILPYKDRLLFFGPVIQSTGSISGTTAGTYYLQDTVIYSENGTPYYTASFTGSAVAGNTAFHPILTPSVVTTQVQGANAAGYFVDITGFGGFITAGYAQPMTTVGYNQDVLIIGFTNRKTKLLYTGNDLLPFNFYIINSELGDTATFSTIVMDRGVISIGDRGITITDQQSCTRIDLEIPDYVFDFDLLNNGTQRITAQRDFVNEWVYFTFPYENEEGTTSPFPNQTLFYNYRDNSWGVFNESYTTYGPFRRQSGFTWQTVGSIFSSWNAWNEPWESSSSSLQEPEVIAGNQQGFIVARDDRTTSEAPSLYISAINPATFTVTSPSHGLNTGDFVYFLNALGMTNFNSYPSGSATITGATQANPCVLTANNTFQVGQQITISGVVGMTQLNGNTYTITAATPTTITINVDSTGFTAYSSGGLASAGPDYIVWLITVTGVNTFTISSDPALPLPILPSGTYMGNGTITRLYIPQIQSKQFPTAWGMGRKTRIGTQQYLFSTTSNAQITLLMYLSQNATTPFNAPKYVPDPNANNNSVVYTDILYTCQESTNLGLTPANINLQQIVPNQAQTWHRQNTSLIGDTVQVEFTLSEEQMFDTTLTNQVAEIELHGMIIDVSPSQMLS